MPEEAKPAITTQNAGVRTTAQSLPQASHDQDGEQKVTVRSLRFVHKDPSLTGEMAKPGDTFETTRSRAAQLRAAGIVEYANEADEKTIHGEADAKRLGDRIRQEDDNRKAPVEKNRTTPLRNPEVKLADLPVDAKK